MCVCVCVFVLVYIRVSIPTGITSIYMCYVNTCASPPFLSISHTSITAASSTGFLSAPHHTYICIYMYIYECLCMYICIYIFMHIYTYNIYIYIYIYMCMYKCMYIYIYIYMYIHIYIFLFYVGIDRYIYNMQHLCESAINIDPSDANHRSVIC